MLHARKIVGVLLVAGLGLAASSPAVRGDDGDARLKRLLDKVARGDEVESAAAADQIIEQVVGSFADAIGPLEDRSVEEIVRLRALMARFSGELRLRVFRADLAEKDRELLDAFAETYPELTRRLFDDHYLVRLAAVNQIPLEPNSGAGVLIAAKVNDEDEDVADAALEMAAKLHDPVVARNLTRYVRDATTTIASGFYGPGEQTIARTVALFVWRASTVIGAAGAAESTPALIEALRFFGRSRYWDNHQRAEVIRALGKLGNPRAAEVLLTFLDDGARLRWRPGEKDKRIQETVGDIALLSLVRVYKLDPGEFGLLVVEAEPEFAGYIDPEARRAGHRDFRIWHSRNAPQPTTQPAASESPKPASNKEKE